MKTRKGLTALINYSVFAYAALPLLSNFVSRVLGGIAYVVIAYLLLFFAVFLNSKGFEKKDKHFILPFVLFVLFISLHAIGTMFFPNHFRTRQLFGTDVTTHFYNFVLSLPMYVACFYVLFKTENESRKKLLFFYSCCLLYTIFISFVALLFVPEFSTNDAAAITTERMQLFYLLGACGYSLTYSLVVILPFFCFYFARTKRVLYLAIIVLGTMTVVKSGFLIATIVLAIDYLFCLIALIKNIIIRNIVVSLLVATIIFLSINLDLVGNFAMFLGKNIPIGSLSKRFMQISNAILHNDFSGDALLGRINVYKKALEGITEHPLFGSVMFNGSYYESGHSTLFDSWASFGILFFMLFLSSLVLFYLKARKMTDDPRVRTICISTVISFLIVSALDQILASPAIFINFFICLGHLAFLCQIERKTNDVANAIFNRSLVFEANK